MLTLKNLKRGCSDEPSASQAAPAPCSGYTCERIAPSVQYPVPDALGMPLKPSAVHDPIPTGGVGTFPCQVRYDPRSAPTRAKSSRWVEPMLGRNPPPTVQESVAAASSQPHVPYDSFHGLPPPQAIPPLPPLPTPGIQPHQSQYHAGYIPSDTVSTQGATTETSQQFGVGFGVPTRGADERGNGAPNPDDIDCERCGCRTTRARARNCVSCRFRCCPNCCRDPLKICRVCMEQASGVPPNHKGPRTLEAIRAMVVGIERLSASPVSSIPSRNPRVLDVGL